MDRSPRSSRAAARRRDSHVRRDVRRRRRSRDGVRAAEARRLALIELGGVEQVKEARSRRPSRRAPRRCRPRRALCVPAVRPAAHVRGRDRRRRSRSASAPTRRSSRSSTASCFARCRSKDPERLAQLVADAAVGADHRGPIRSGRRSSATPIGSTACSRGAGSTRSSTWRKAARRSCANGVWASAGSFDVLGVKPRARPDCFVPSDDVRGGGSGRPGRRDQPRVLAASTSAARPT